MTNSCCLYVWHALGNHQRVLYIDWQILSPNKCVHSSAVESVLIIIIYLVFAIDTIKRRQDLHRSLGYNWHYFLIYLSASQKFKFSIFITLLLRIQFTSKCIHIIKIYELMDSINHLILLMTWLELLGSPLTVLFMSQFFSHSCPNQSLVWCSKF